MGPALTRPLGAVRADHPPDTEAGEPLTDVAGATPAQHRDRKAGGEPAQDRARARGETGGGVERVHEVAGDAVRHRGNGLEFPADWAILLCLPEDSTSWHGLRERQAFARLSRLAPSPAETETLCRVVLMSLLPALASGNLDAFGDALHEFNARVGDVFAPAQGGRYGSPAIAECVQKLRSAGLRGVGQSSWGPTVFAIVPRSEAERWLNEINTIPAWVTRASAGAEITQAARGLE